jgi:hypothetical protein
LDSAVESRHGVRAVGAAGLTRASGRPRRPAATQTRVNYGRFALSVLAVPVPSEEPHPFRGEPAVSSPMRAAAGRLPGTSCGPACASSGRCSRPAGRGETAERVAKRPRQSRRPDDRVHRKASVAACRHLASAGTRCRRIGAPPSGAHRRRRRDAHLCRRAGNLRFRTRDLSANESEAPDGAATPGSDTCARGQRGASTSWSTARRDPLASRCRVLHDRRLRR